MSNQNRAKRALGSLIFQAVDALLDIASEPEQRVLGMSAVCDQGEPAQAVAEDIKPGEGYKDPRSPEDRAKAQAAMAEAFPLIGPRSGDVLARVIAGCLKHKDPKVRRLVNRLLTKHDVQVNTPYISAKDATTAELPPVVPVRVKRAAKKQKGKATNKKAGTRATTRR